MNSEKWQKIAKGLESRTLYNLSLKNRAVVNRLSSFLVDKWQEAKGNKNRQK
jgi:hypothetical protein